MQKFKPMLGFVRDVLFLVAAALALAAGLSLLQPSWTMAFIQGTLYAGSTLFLAGTLLLGLQIFDVVTWQAAGVPSPWQRWYLWGFRALTAGLVVFFLGLWLQGTILGEWIELPPPPA